jgi:hypothetical protein
MDYNNQPITADDINLFVSAATNCVDQGKTELMESLCRAID